MRAVNLLPRDDSGQGRDGPAAPVLVACGGAVVLTLVLALGFLSASSKVGHQKSALADLQAQLAAVPKPQTESPVAGKLAQERQSRVGALAAALSTRVAWDRILREVSLVVPDDVWLINLSAKSPGAGGAPPPTPSDQFVVSGYTYSQDGVARLLSRLAVLPDLSHVNLESSTRQKVGNRSVFQFKIDAGVRATGATS